MEKKYQRGKIYKIVDVGYNKCYIGSTAENCLSSRMSRHRYDYKIYKQTLQKKMRCFDIFDEYGVENCKIELIEHYPCNSIEELRKREGYFIQNAECVNRCVAGRTKNEWHYDNKEHCNKKSNTHYYNNREQRLRQEKERRELNKGTINAKKKVSHLCECGVSYTNSHKARHKQTQRHQHYINSLQD